MKRTTPNHPKTLDLMARLALPKYAAVGLLESLFHFGQAYAQAGDIGRHTDEAIAAALGWTGDAQALIETFVASRWLDRCECHRLRIHDWPDHADQTTQRALKARNQWFLACYAEPSMVLGASKPPCRAVTVPSRAVPEPEPNEPVAATARAAPPNPLAPDRLALEREALVLTRQIAERDGVDGAEVFGDASEWRGSRKVNPAAIESLDRLLNTVITLRKRWRQDKPPPSAKAQARMDRLRVLATGRLDGGQREGVDAGDGGAGGGLPGSGRGALGDGAARPGLPAGGPAEPERPPVATRRE